MRTRVRKIWRDLWSRKVRTLLVSSSIFIGVFGVVTLFSAGDLLIKQLEKDIRQDRLAMIRVAVTVSSGAEVDNEANLAALENLPGLEIAEGRAVYPVYWQLPGGTRFIEGRIAAYSKPFGELQLEAPRKTEGEYPVAGQNQIAIERRMADRYGLEIGDVLDLRLLSLSGDAAAGGEVQTQSYTISGFMFQPYGEQSGPGFADPQTLIFATYEDAQQIAGFTGLNLIYTRFIDYPTADQGSTNLQATIANETPYTPTFTVVEDPAKSPLIENQRNTNQVLLFLAVVALIVSGFLVVNVINSIVVEQRRQIGVMKSLGASRRDNFFIYSGMAAMYGLIGVIPGVLLGIPGGYFAAQFLASQNQTLIEEFAVAPVGIIVGIVVGLAVPFLASVLPVLAGTNVSIREAMTDVGIRATYGRGPIARLIMALPMPITLRQAVNNVNQKKFRLALTGTTLTLAVGAFMGIFAVFSSLSGVIDDVFAAWGWEVNFVPSQGQEFETMTGILAAPGVATTLDEQGLNSIKTIEPSAGLALEIEGYDPPPVQAGPPGIFGVGVNTENPSLLQLNLTSGTDWRDDPNRGGVILSSRIGDLMGKVSGDRVVLVAGGGRQEFEVIGVASYPFDTVWMPWQDLARLGGLINGAPSAAEYGMGRAYAQVEGYTGSGPDGQTGILGLSLAADDPMSRMLSFEDGRFVEAGQPEVIISAALAEQGGYEVGDALRLSFGGGSGEYTVAGIFDLPQQLTENPDHLRDVIGIYWEELATLEGRDLSGDIYPNQIAIQLDAEEPTAQEVDGVIEVINERLLENGITGEFTNWPEFKETITGFIRAFNIILYMAAALIAAVGAVGLLTTLSMSVFERQKEIGVMRSVGATSGAVTFQFLVEGLIVGIAAWVIGIPLGYLISRGLAAALPFDDLAQGFPPITILIGFIGMIIVVTVASLWPSLGAARKTVSDILRYQ